MSPQLSTRCALAVLVSMLFGSAVGLLAWGPVGLETQAHRLTDPRVIGGFINGWSVWLQLPLLIAAIAGSVGAARGRPRNALRHAWAMFFGLVALAATAGMVDHLMPSAAGYVLSKLVTASACALLSLIFVAERMGLGWVSRLATTLAVASGPVGGLMCLVAYGVTGQPDVRLLLLLEHLPLILVPLGVWSLRSRGLGATDWLVALLLFALAKAIDALDLSLWALTAGGISGHALHHLPLGLCVGWLAWRVARQFTPRTVALPAASADAEASVAVKRRSTSLTTSG